MNFDIKYCENYGGWTKILTLEAITHEKQR